MRFQPLVQNLLLDSARTLVLFLRNAQSNPHEIFRVCAGRHEELAIKNEHNRSLALLTHLLAPQCSLRSHAPLRSLASSLAYSLVRLLTHALPSSWEGFFYEMNASS